MQRVVPIELAAEIMETVLEYGSATDMTSWNAAFLGSMKSKKLNKENELREREVALTRSLPRISLRTC